MALSQIRITSLISFALVVFAAENSLALPSFKRNNHDSSQTILKADQVDGDRATNTLVADGNVEVIKGSSVLRANSLIYKKNDKMLFADGDVRVKDFEVGNLKASKLEMKDDFSAGKFFDSKIFFNDGSYLTSPQVERKSPLITVLKNPVFSICPNPEISANNDVAGKRRDFFSIKSTQTTIDRVDNVMRSKGGVMRFYNVPVFYTPRLTIALPSKDKKSGFLHPSYAKSTNLGLGIKIPYYFYIAPNMDLTTTPLIGVNNKQVLVANEFRHKASYGEYNLNLEVANNKLTSKSDTTITKRSDKKYRWNFTGKGRFDFTTNTGLDFVANAVGDRDYLRDYHFNYLNYGLSKVNLDYIRGRTYHAAKMIRIQELENSGTQKSAPMVLPQLDSHIESKPFFFKEKLALTSNLTVITREDGLEYRRATMTPELNVPLNLRGNLFSFNAKAQGDFYWLENQTDRVAASYKYRAATANYKPEVALNWRLPLIKKSKKNTLLIEPMANVVVSSYSQNFSYLPNEDSNGSELSVSNLFVSDRIAGFDRNESGKRFNYGVKSSFFNDYGEFGLTVGQGYRKSENAQDAVIKGFNANNKSNLVGQAMYKAVKYFSLIYSFQLDESSYRNDVNQVSSSLVFDRVSFTSDYLLIRRNQQNLQKKEQLSLGSSVKLSNRWSMALGTRQDIVLGRTLSRSISFLRDGCCTTFGFSVMETNPSNLTKPQQSFNISLLFKNL